MQERRKIAVAGATGRVGRHTVEVLEAARRDAGVAVVAGGAGGGDERERLALGAERHAEPGDRRRQRQQLQLCGEHDA